MARLTRLTQLELQIMEALWSHGPSSIREVQQAFPAKKRPAYTTVQTTIYRLETKGVMSRNAAQSRLIDDLLGMFGGRTQPVMAHLIESGKLTLEDVQQAEKLVRKHIEKNGKT
jgi:BlaI family penicillinase repressor